MKANISALEKQLAKKQKEVKDIEKKIESEKAKNKPKDIRDLVKSMKDVLRISKPTKEELTIINYSGKSKRLLFAKNFLIISLISEVLNEGWKPKTNDSEYRYYPYFYLKAVSSGFDFRDSACVYDYAVTGSASRLCFKTSELAEYAGKTFLKEYQNAIMN